MAGGNVKFIGYFDAFPITADDAEAAAARELVLDFGDGVKLSKQPTRKGLYIRDAKKVVIK